MTDAALLDNLAALMRQGLTVPAPEPRPVVTGSADQLRLVTPDGRLVRLHSARDPRREAQRQIDEAVGDRAVTLVAVLGAGDGTVLELLESRPDVGIVAIEPFPAGARAWLARRAWTDAISAGRLILLVGPAYDGLPLMARRLATDVDHVPVIANPVLVREYPDALAAARQALDRLIGAMRANATARTRFEDTAFVNTLTNLPAILAGGDVAALTGAFSGVPAIVLGAGPSLTHNLDALAARPWPGLVVCVDTAIQPCLAAAVTPHIVAAVDPTALNARHLDGRPAPDSYLVAEASVDPHAVERFDGRAFFFRVGDHAPWAWLVRHGLDLGRLDVWGSVVTASVDLVRLAGCTPIVFAGLDLAWTADEPYCRHTIYEEDWAREVVWGRPLRAIWQTALAQRQAVREPGLDGRPCLSTLDLVAFRDWLRAYTTTHRSVTFVNATGSGILHGERLAQRELAEVLADLPSPACEPFVRLRARHTRATGRADAATLAAALRATPPQALLEGHSASGRWTRHALATLAAAASDALTANGPVSTATPGVVRRAPVPYPPIPMPEQIAQARHWLPLTGTAPVPAGTTHDRQRADRWLRAALAHLTDLASMDTAILGLGGEIAHLPHAPAPLIGTWTRAARCTASDVADCLAAALAAADGLPTRGDPGPGDVPAVVSHPAEPVEDTAVTALAGLAEQWCRHAAAVSRQAPVDAGLVSLVLGPFPLADRSAGSPAAAAGGPGTVRSWLAAARGAASRRAGPLVPLLVDAHRHRVDGPAVAVLVREALSPHRLAPRLVVATLDDTHAILTRDDGSGSDLLHAGGNLQAAEPWPRPVSAEIPFEGGRVAWDRRGGGHFLWRPAPGAAAHVIALPFLPYDMCVQGDAVYLASNLGLWRWSPRGAVQSLGGAMPLYVVHAHRAGVRAYGWPADHGRGPEIVEAWDWRADGAHSRHPLQPGHAIHDLSVQGPWRAEAWSDARLIRVAHDAGRWWWLTVPPVRTLAWAGPSLIATLTLEADVIRFPDLRSHLSAQL